MNGGGTSRARARLQLHFPDEAAARIVADALLPEVGDDLPKARSRLSRDGARVDLEVSAADLPSLRAGVNSYLRWVRTAVDAAEAGAGEGAPR